MKFCVTFSPLSRVKTNPRSKNSIQTIQIYISELRGRFFCLFFCFFLPGLFEYEKRYYSIYCKSFTFFYFLSFFFSWYILLPVLWSFFMQFEIHKELICIQLEARIFTNIQFILKTFTISQFVFQLPLLCFFCIKKFEINPKQSKFVQQNRSLFYILILLFCSLFSPPEIFFQLLSSLFFILFFESIIYFIYLSEYYRSH